MQIVIEIPEEEYFDIVRSDRTVFADRASKECILHAIRNGTPLPQGHGRIIDESKITKCYMPINQLDVRGIRTDAPTIIEGSETSWK